MDFGKFLETPEYDIKIITYRDIFQSEALESSLFGDEYKDLSAIIKLDSNDMEKMGIKSGNTVYLKNKYGSVVVKAVESDSENPHRGYAYMPNSPWSNALVSDETGNTGVPNYKLIGASLSDAEGEDIADIEKLEVVNV
ncbi:molybdopterin dinucleotide-binding region [Methanohalobium evestigatum Z-7303]|uniref:Molybdopterin dinucleotide-binding region n=1 Tax=Methanohalobium evestigatum (strain ATCC BAA-1072 / DSM 3721 / NBRC 107634 / OCM 161 / Z-7303) TaxID=644295 RepID=D7E9L5_METEZ|nr:molybdopterin dinucleotide binding domain-containing protein [Methanohalobium evestigatum]ADI74287.1 molybdopterin dinucleotide-binding region [Methanohalobium evestigatum Z-7303]